ncbi:MAG: adenylate/guanylate cyclase domain-containing protein [Solirubrobacteraceae bacterium]|jgi:class 3 adenylate cyclase
MVDPIDRAVRAVARRNSFALVWAQFGIAHLVILGGLGLLRLYQPMTATRFWVLVAVSQGLIAIDNAISIRLTMRMWRPVRAWERGARDPQSTVAAWRALATLPIEYLRRLRRFPFFGAYLPFVAFTTWELALPWYAFAILAGAGTVVLAYSLIVRYFTMEVVVRPVLEEVARTLPHDFEIDAAGLPLRWRLLAVAPVINVITGVVVAGLSTHGHHATLDDLGASWLIAIAVSFTISLELVILLVRSLGSSLTDLQSAVARVRAGDYAARVPVVAADETGALAQSFNTMIEGLDERERLRAAFGAYVDPGVAERVLKEGAQLAGEEREVSILFLDIRDFTAFAERSAPTEVVALLNGLWELAVPALRRHGGQAIKFVGDGLLGVFGAPLALDDHAERAVDAALEIADLVDRRLRGRCAVGIGVNSGRVIAGTVGGGGRMEFTVIGDAVNTAERVEAATRATGDDVLITDATRALLPAGRFALHERRAVILRGKANPVPLWSPRRPDAPPPARRAHLPAGAAVRD